MGERGASAVEYALLVAAIGAIMLAVGLALSEFAAGSFRDQCSNFGTANAVNATADINSAGKGC